MGYFNFYGGKIWKENRLTKNNLFCIEVENEINRDIYLEESDIITPGLYDIHCHLWGQKDAVTNHELLSVSFEHMLSTGVIGCSDAGSYGYNDWIQADRMWSLRPDSIKSWINIFPDGLIYHNRPFNFPSADQINKEKLIELYSTHKKRLLGFKLMQGQSEGSIEKEREWLKLAREVADMAGTNIMVHITNSLLDVRETLEYMKKGDIISHAYNNSGCKGKIIDDQGNIFDEVVDARKRGVLFELSQGRRHFSYKVYQQAHDIGFEPDFIATDINMTCYRKIPMVDLVYVISKVIAAGMDKEIALRAAIDNPSKYMKMEKDYKQNLLVLKMVNQPTIYQDTILKELDSKSICADWRYRASYCVYKNHCIFINK